jgi:hypothetical protein
MLEAHSQLASYSFAATSARSGLSRALDNPALPEVFNRRPSLGDVLCFRFTPRDHAVGRHLSTDVFRG